MSVTNTLAYRNKNPLNLRPLPNGDRWQGQFGVHTNNVSGAFCIFEDNTWGVRAAVKNLISYTKFSGIKTLREAIYRWAPPNVPEEVAMGVGNHTEAYVNSVVKYVQSQGYPLFDENYDLSWMAKNHQHPSDEQINLLAHIIKGMNRVEAGGETIRYDEAINGINRAFGLYTGQ